MARRGRRTGRGYGRRFARGAKRAVGGTMRMIGISKSGIKVSNAILTGGAIATFLVPAGSTDSQSSALAAFMGWGPYASNTPQQRITNGLNNLSCALIGKNLDGTASTSTYKGFGGKVLLGGVALKVAGRFINQPFLSGSPVRL